MPVYHSNGHISISFRPEILEIHELFCEYFFANEEMKQIFSVLLMSVEKILQNLFFRIIKRRKFKTCDSLAAQGFLSLFGRIKNDLVQHVFRGHGTN